MTKIALILIKKRIKDLGFPPTLNSPIKIVIVVHDKILLC